MSAELLEELRATTRQALAAGTGDIVDALGLSGLLVDADRGGLGLGEPEMALVATELGRALAPRRSCRRPCCAVTLCRAEAPPMGQTSMAALAGGSAGCAVAIPPLCRLANSPDIAATHRTGWRLAAQRHGRGASPRPTRSDDAVLGGGRHRGRNALFVADAGHVESRSGRRTRPGPRTGRGRGLPIRRSS